MGRNGAITTGARGDSGQNLVRDSKTYKQNLSKVDFSKRKSKAKEVIKKGGKTTYVY